MSNPTSREPVNAMKRVFGWATRPLPKVAPEPGQKLTTPAGMPAYSSASKNFAAMVGESLDGLRTTVLPHTRLAPAMPSAMALGKFHGEITRSEEHTSELQSPCN